MVIWTHHNTKILNWNTYKIWTVSETLKLYALQSSFKKQYRKTVCLSLDTPEIVSTILTSHKGAYTQTKRVVSISHLNGMLHLLYKAESPSKSCIPTCSRASAAACC